MVQQCIFQVNPICEKLYSVRWGNTWLQSLQHTAHARCRWNESKIMHLKGPKQPVNPWAPAIVHRWGPTTVQQRQWQKSFSRRQCPGHHQACQMPNRKWFIWANMMVLFYKGCGIVLGILFFFFRDFFFFLVGGGFGAVQAPFWENPGVKGRFVRVFQDIWGWF